MANPSAYAVARVAAAAAVVVPGVVTLDAGAVGEFATYGDGQRVRGVRVATGAQPSATVRIVVAYGRPVVAVADLVREQVRMATAELLSSEPMVNVEIVDVQEEATT